MPEYCPLGSKHVANKHRLIYVDYLWLYFFYIQEHNGISSLKIIRLWWGMRLQLSKYSEAKYVASDLLPAEAGNRVPCITMERNIDSNLHHSCNHQQREYRWRSCRWEGGGCMVRPPQTAKWIFKIKNAIFYRQNRWNYHDKTKENSINDY